MSVLRKIFFFVLCLNSLCLMARKTGDGNLKGYLFVYFTGNAEGEESIHFALSRDGYHYEALNNDRSILDAKTISETGGVRDPHILRANNGWFYMVVTDMRAELGWDSNRGMILLKSKDLLHWTSSCVNIQKKYAGQENLKRVWAPQTIYDSKARKYLVYWSMKHGDGADIIYYAYANRDFTDIEGTPKPFFLPADRNSCIDGDLAVKDGVYHLFYKTEGHGNGIKVASTYELTSGQWQEQPDYKQQTTDAVEGAGTFKLIGQDKYILMYDVYMKGRYEFAETSDFKTFKKVSGEVHMNFHPRHGTVIALTEKEYQRLSKAFPSNALK